MKIIEGRDCEIVKGSYAYKNEIFYPLWETKQSIIADCFMGKMNYVLGEDGEILSFSYPMGPLNNDFLRLDTATIEKWGKMYSAYLHMKKHT